MIAQSRNETSSAKTKAGAASVPVIIRGHGDIRAGIRILRRRCAVLRAMHDRTGDPPLRRYRADFAGLARIIVGQQLSIASAEAIWARLSSTLGVVDAAAIELVDPAMLRQCGLSAAKIATLRALADAVRARKDALRLKRLTVASDDEVRAALTRVKGVGPWTADIFVLFCLGRADAWAAGDLALQVGVARAFGLGERVGADETLRIAEQWRPWRGVAARLIWADYAYLRALGDLPKPGRTRA